jgi:two-component system LytT family response regulator
MKNNQIVTENNISDSFNPATPEITEEGQLKIITLNPSTNDEPKRKEKIAIYKAPYYHIFPIDDIVYLEADGPYTNIHVQSEKMLTACVNLRAYEDQLAGYNFFRIHKSYIVNLSKITRYCRAEGGYVLMHNEQKLYISSHKKEGLLEKLENDIIVVGKTSKLL